MEDDMATARETDSASILISDGQNDSTKIHRILDLLESGHRRTWMEVACAIVLSLATTCSAWCAYQSKIWSGEQARQSGAAASKTRESARKVLLAYQTRTLEAIVFIKYFEAKQAGDGKLAEFYANRLPTATKAALLSWWKLKPLENPSAPEHPFLMPEYKQPELDLASQLENDARAIDPKARDAGRNSDTYVLLTVLFASVLFFGGVGNTFESRRLRRTMIYVAIALFVVTFAALVVMPTQLELPFGSG
jgi:hypothetical protein